MSLARRTGSSVMVTFCFAVLLCFSNPAGASQGWHEVQPGMARIFLSMAGLETDSVALDRGDGIQRALYIANLKGNDVLIGFPDAGIGRDVPFLLAINGEELTVEASAQGELNVLEGDPAVLPTDVGDFISCLLGNIVDLVRAILQLNIGGIIGNLFELIGCIFSIL